MPGGSPPIPERCEADARISGDGAQLPEVVGAGVAMSACRGDAAHFESLRGIVAHVALRVKSFTRSADPDRVPREGMRLRFGEAASRFREAPLWNRKAASMNREPPSEEGKLVCIARDAPSRSVSISSAPRQ